MASEFEPNQDVSTIWQNQKSEGVHMSVAEIGLRAGKYNHKVLWRNAREYIAALAVTVLFSINFLHTDDMLTRFGFGLIVAGMIYVCWHLHSNGSARVAAGSGRCQLPAIPSSRTQAPAGSAARRMALVPGTHDSWLGSCHSWRRAFKRSPRKPLRLGDHSLRGCRRARFRLYRAA